MAIVGEASVVIRALIDRFNNDLKAGFRKAEKDADKAGDSAGTKFGESFADAVQPEIDGVNFGNVNTRAEQEGAESGGRFGDGFASKMQDVLEGIEYPDVSINVEATVDEEGARGFADRMAERLRGLDDAASAALTRMRQRASEAGDESGGNFADRFGSRLYDLDTQFLDRIRGFRSGAGDEGDAAGEAFGSRLMSRLNSMDDGAINWVRGIRTQFGDSGRDSGDSFVSSLGSRLRFGGQLVGLQVQQMFSRAEPEARVAGGNAGNGFGNALRTSLANANIEPPDFGGRLGAKILAVIPLIGILGGAISALGGGFVALAGTVGQAAGVLGALPGLFAGIIGTVLAGVVAFGGVGDAISALGEEQAQAGRDALAGARQQEQAARQIEAAQDAVVAARERVSDAAEGIVRANERVTRAEENVIRAQEQVVLATERVTDAQENLIDAGENVIRAQEDLARAFEDTARANEDAARSVADAERDYVEALDEERQAQNDLQQAREDAAESLEDLAFGLRDANLDVDGSLLALEETRARLAAVANDETATDRERRQAQLAFDRAQLSYDKAVDRLAETEAANAEAIAAGIDGSSQVINAQDRIADAIDGTADAARRVTDAQEDQVRTQEDGARRIADAQDGVQDAVDGVADAQRGVRDALRGVRDAQQGVTDAYRGVEEAQRGVTEAQKEAEKAATALSRAQRDLGRAQRDAAEGAGALSTAQQNVKDALAGLSPEAASFAMLVASLKPEFEGLRAAAGVELFPKLETALKNVVENFFPALEGALRQAGSSLGDFAVTMGDLFADPEFQGNFSGFFTGFYEGIDGGVAPAQNLYNTVRNLTGGLFGLAEASLPLISRFTTWIELMSSNFLSKTTGDTSDLTEKLNRAGDVAARIGDLFGAVFGALGNTFSIGAETGNSFLESLTKQAEKWEEWTEKSEGVTRIGEYFDNIKPNVESLGTFVLELIQLFTRLGENKSVGETFDALTGEMGTLETVIANFTDLGPQLTELLGSVLELLATVSESSAFSTFISSLTGMAGALNTLLNIPGVAQFAGVLLTLAAGMKAVSFFTKFTGLQFLTQTLGKGLFGASATKGIPAFIQGLRGVSTAGSSVAAIIGTNLRVALFAAGTAIKGFGVAVATALGPIGLIVLAVIAVGAALVLLYNKSETFRDIVDGAIDTIIEGFQDFINMMTVVGDAVNGFINGVIDFFQHLYDVLVGNSIIPDLVNAIIGFFQGLWDTVAGIVSGLVDAVVGFFTGLYDTGVQLFTDLMNGISEIWESIKEVFTDAFGAVAEFAAQWWTNFKNNTTTAFNLVKDAISAVWEFVKKVFTDAWDAVAAFAKQWWINLKNNTTTAFNLVKDAISAVWTTIKQVFTDAFKAVKDAFDTFWGNLKSSAETLFGKVKTAMDLVMGGILAAFGYLKSETERIWNDILAKVRTPVRTVVDVVYNKGVRGFWNPIAGVVGAPTLPEAKFAKGGYVPGYAPGRDTVRAILSPGEGILVPEAVRAIAREMGVTPARAMQSINSKYSSRVAGPGRNDGVQRFAGGGLVTKVPSSLRNAKGGFGFLGEWIGSIKDFVVGNFAKLGRKALDTLATSVSSLLPDKGVTRYFRRFPQKIADQLVGFLAKKDNEGGGSGTIGNGDIKGAGYAAIINYLRSTGVPGIVTSTFRPGGTSYHGKGRAADFSVGGHLNKGYGNEGLRRIFNAFLPVGGDLVELILAGAPFNIKNGKRVPGYAWGKPGQPGNHWNHVHAALADGGIVRARRGGTVALLGEAGRDETVVDTASLNRFVSLVRAAVVENANVNQSAVQSGGQTLVLSEGAVNMTIVNPKAETAEETLNDRMRALGELGVLQRMLPKT